MQRGEIFKLGKLNKYEYKSHNSEINVYSAGCDDWCEIRIASLKPTISNIQFAHRGCLLSKAAINAVIEAIQGKTKDEAMTILLEFRQMLFRPKFEVNIPECLLLFRKFSQFPSRRTCVLLGCNSIVSELIRENHG